MGVASALGSEVETFWQNVTKGQCAHDGIDKGMIENISITVSL